MKRRNTLVALVALVVVATLVGGLLLTGLGQNKAAVQLAQVPPAAVSSSKAVDPDKVAVVDPDKAVDPDQLHPSGGDKKKAEAVELYPAPKIERFANGIESVADVRHDVSLPLRDLAPLKGGPRADNPDEESREATKQQLLKGHQDGPDPVVQKDFGINAMPGINVSFAGIGTASSTCGGCYPPDTNGEIGPNHYVQTVNTAFQVFSRTGTSLYGPAANNTIWTGFGGPCQTSNDGDPVVLYDQIADRWLMSQFTASAPYYECVAVSTSPDPTGTWNRYAFQTDSTIFPDYPKLSVWPDGYYMTTNEFAGGSSYVGPRPYAFDRQKMLQGQPATFQRNAAALGNTFGPLLPVDLDGSVLPAAGTPGYFIGLDSVLRIYKFQVNWVTPANSSFTSVNTLTPAAFTELCPSTRACIAQSGTTAKLDGIGDRLMFRAPFRPNVGGNGGSVLLTHQVNVGSGQAGVRWYELRGITTNSPSIFQQGTFAPDTTSRWMGSIAMDASSNIAVGYSASSSTLFPSIRYAGRLAADPLGQLTQGEATLLTGASSQTASGNRWGDYSDMSIDPLDDCTFWFTTEYNIGGGASWATRIGSFKFPTCITGTPTATITPGGPTLTPTPTTPPTFTATATATPDPCNYNYVVTTGSIVTATTVLAGFTPNRDDGTASLTLPFAYTFHNQSFNTVNVSTNGNLQFSSNDSEYANTALPATTLNNTIFPYWDDLNMTAAGRQVLTSVTGSAPNRILNIVWDTAFFTGGANLVFEVRLYEGQQRFDLLYGTGATGSSATIGSQKGTGSLYNQFSFNTASVNPGTQINVTINPACGTPTATGTSAPATSTSTATSTATRTTTATSSATNTATATSSATSTATNTAPAGSTATSTVPAGSTATSTVPAGSTATNTVPAGSTATATLTGTLGTPTVTATACSISFSDVLTTNIFYGDIQYLACRGIVNGTGGGLFSPNANTTRGQFAKITTLGFGLPPFTPTGSQSFVDVAPASIFYGFIEAAAHSGAVNGLTASQCASLGTPGSCYGPNINISRAQVVVIVQRVRAYSLFTPTAATFSDVPSGSFGYQAIETLVNKGIISGAACTGGSGLCFRPNDSIKRGELSKVVRRAIETLAP